MQKFDTTNWENHYGGSEPHPAPEIPARPPTAGETPRSARAFLAAADGHNWETRATFARGHTLDRRGDAASVVDSLLVRAVKAPLRVSAVWLDGAFSFGYAVVDGVNPYRRGLRHLTAIVKASS